VVGVGDTAGPMFDSSLPVYVADSPSPRRPRGSNGLKVVALVVCIVLIGVVTSRQQAPSPGVAPSPSTSVSAPDSVPGDIVALPAGGPSDGLGTKMFPVHASPDKDLVSGQTVILTGTGFPARTQVGAVMCTGAARTQGAAACDLAHTAPGTLTDAEGAFSFSYTVSRFPQINGHHVDCTSGNVDPDDYAALIAREGPKPTSSDPNAATCIIAVGDISNYDNSGGWPIAFRGETFVHGGASPGTRNLGR
jgi:hypothetical protein